MPSRLTSAHRSTVHLLDYATGAMTGMKAWACCWINSSITLQYSLGGNRRFINCDWERYNNSIMFYINSYIDPGHHRQMVARVEAVKHTQTIEELAGSRSRTLKISEATALPPSPKQFAQEVSTKYEPSVIREVPDLSC